MTTNPIASIGVPRETKDGEYRVAMTPAAARRLREAGARVLIERDAGRGAGFADAEYASAGAELVSSAGEAFEADLVVKVKEPSVQEVARLHEGQTLFTFVHLPGNPHLAEPLRASGARVLAYERVRDEAGAYPILRPMSWIAGRLAAQIGAHYLLGVTDIGDRVGRGVLLGQVPGTEAALTAVLGAGTVGAQAARIARGLGSRVLVFDRDEQRARDVASDLGDGMSAAPLADLPRVLPDVSLVIGAVHVAGSAAPRLLTRDLVSTMPHGAVAVDVAIDEGGCFETSRPTSHSEPVYVDAGVIHYCVPNMPSLVARSATEALVAATLPYVRLLLSAGVRGFLSHPGCAGAAI